MGKEEMNENLASQDESVNENSASHEEDTPSVEDLMVQLAQAQAETEKYKNANDKLSKESAEYKRKLREKQSAEEVADEMKRQQEEQHKEYVASLERQIALIDATNRYLEMGMDKKMASETAKAELDGDKEAVSSNIQKMMSAKIKAAEAEWIKSRPDIEAGDDSKKEEDAIEAAFRNNFPAMKQKK